MVEIVEVKKCFPRGQRAVACNIELPKPGEQLDKYAFQVRGWVLGLTCQIKTVELVYRTQVIGRAQLGARRDDVAAAHADNPAAIWSGFAMEVGVIGLPQECELFVYAVRKGGGKIQLALLKIRQSVVPASLQSNKLQPLMLTCMGRSGTTWAMRLLIHHPRIVADSRYPYEIRAGQYWAHMLRTLSQPADYSGSSKPTVYSGPWVGPNPYFQLDSQASSWLGKEYVERLAEFCKGSITDFYTNVAQQQGKPEAQYFVEKIDAPSHSYHLLQSLYPGSREIILVRDVRDTLCSIRAFNSKRGVKEFGQHAAKSEGDDIRILGHSARALQMAWRARQSRAFLLRYEDLVAKPDESLGKILDYLTLSDDSNVRSLMLERVSRDAHTLSFHRTSRSPGESLGRWREELNEQEKAVAEDVFQGYLKEFGYSS